ncbi:unnamed protein product, partial [Meganyctiphanes norvegica]
MLLLILLLLLLLLLPLLLPLQLLILVGVLRSPDELEFSKKVKQKSLSFHERECEDDPDATTKFIRLNRAYEVLKDEDLRKKYDLHGEEGLDDSGGQNYHSWNYYKDNFGIYDEDPEIITLNKADFEMSVTGSTIWFINFYHPMCSHCHTLAPVWREVARELEGVIRIGAVNCDDDYHLCSSQGIGSYPSLLFYPGRHVYQSSKTKEQLMNYVLRQVDSQVDTLTNDNLEIFQSSEEYKTRPWIVAYYTSRDEVDEFWLTEVKLGAMFKDILNFGRVECFQHNSKELCKEFDSEMGIKFFNAEELARRGGQVLSSLNAQEIAREVMAFMPEITELSYDKYQEVRQMLRTQEESVAWLIHFSSQSDDDNFEHRKLPGLLPNLNLGRVDCSAQKAECDELYISRTPSFILFKPNGGYELHKGRLLAQDIANFAREGASSSNFQILTPKEFPEVLRDGSLWFVDFYAPWCPPCMKLLPEFRKASRLVEEPVMFGSIDCTAHSGLCNQFNIRQYPTTILYNNSIPHSYTCFHTANQIVEFVKDTLHPVVQDLDGEQFDDLILQKPRSKLYVVDYFANWCGPCNDMAPEYSRFARMVQNIPGVKIIKIDCAKNSATCRQQSINSYPTIRLYGFGNYGTRSFVQYDAWNRDAAGFRQWLQEYLPSKVTTLSDMEDVLDSSEPWIVDFYAPWCGHCQVFAPTFEDIATDLEGQVKAGKVNCQQHQWLCNKMHVNEYPTVRFYRGTVRGQKQNVYGYTMGTLTKDWIMYELNQRIPRVKHDEL